jgi:predicted Rdx family selenoprotein
MYTANGEKSSFNNTIEHFADEQQGYTTYVLSLDGDFDISGKLKSQEFCFNDRSCLSKPNFTQIEHVGEIYENIDKYKNVENKLNYINSEWDNLYTNKKTYNENYNNKLQDHSDQHNIYIYNLINEQVEHDKISNDLKTTNDADIKRLNDLGNTASANELQKIESTRLLQHTYETDIRTKLISEYENLDNKQKNEQTNINLNNNSLDQLITTRSNNKADQLKILYDNKQIILQKNYRKDSASKIRQNFELAKQKCPEKDNYNVPVCPADTIKCTDYKGYCFDPLTNTMISTYNVPYEDACDEKGTSGNKHKTINNVRVWTRQDNKDYKQCANFKDELKTKCPRKDELSRPECPSSLVKCENIKGYCFNPNTNNMVSTFFEPAIDKCSEAGFTSGRQYDVVDGVRVWNRRLNKDTLYCSNFKQELQQKCPPKNLAPQCPSDTTQCTNKQGYCFDPNKNEMVSTYYTAYKDSCPELYDFTGQEPRYLPTSNVRVWKQQDLRDIYTCSNFKDEADSKCKVSTATDLIACPTDTVTCADKPGYCYHNTIGMVSTYYDPNEDKCIERNVVTGQDPITINGVRVWKRQPVSDTVTCSNLT